MTAGHWDPMTAGSTGHGHLRASDADRDRAIDTLGAAFVTYYAGFLVLFLLAFVGVTVTARL